MKPIKLTTEAKNKALERFRKMVEEYTGDSDLTVKITADSLINNFENITKPTVFLTTEAYLQINLLVNQSSNELAWHGVVEKINNDYLISHVLVYPQTVTGTTVDADEKAYAQWLMRLNDDTINHLRFQGHSHVNMPASPSGRDTSNWQKFLNLLKKDEFYIFCIANKKGDFYWNIYDTAKNIIFENKDITMCVVDEKGNNLKDWATDSIKEFIKEPPRHTINYKDYYTHGTQTNAFNNAPVGFATTSTTPNKPIKRAFEDSIPDAIKDRDVHYEPDFDLYYSECYIPKFRYSNTWGCYTMEGDECRKAYGEPKAKRGPGRPKKENKQEKKGG